MVNYSQGGMQFIKLRLLHAIMKACVRNTDALNPLMDDEETWNGMSSLLGLLMISMINVQKQKLCCKLGVGSASRPALHSFKAKRRPIKPLCRFTDLAPMSCELGHR